MSYLAVFAMWLAMTAAMMAPVVYPWLRALSRIAHAPRSTVDALKAAADAPKATLHALGMIRDALTSPRSVIPFAGGYMVAWTGFSAAAAAVHLTLAAMALPVPFAMDAPVLSAVALGMAGTFQFTRLKEACLSHCRSPAGFLLTRWRPGAAGHARLGFEHGLHCVGCCWALMALALVVGMVDLLWMGVLMAVMVAETTLPFGARLTRPLGIALLAGGAVVLVVALRP